MVARAIVRIAAGARLAKGRNEFCREFAMVSASAREPCPAFRDRRATPPQIMLPRRASNVQPGGGER